MNRHLSVGVISYCFVFYICQCLDIDIFEGFFYVVLLKNRILVHHQRFVENLLKLSNWS